MPGPGAIRAAIVVAGVLSVALGAFHFFLPVLWDWGRGMQSAPDSLAWALQALNAFWSALALLGGVLVLSIGIRRWWLQPAARWALRLLALYWLLHAVYLALVPFPLPRQMASLAIAFLVFPLVQALLHALGGFAPAAPQSSTRGKGAGE